MSPLKFWLRYLIIGATSFGGYLSMIGIMQRQLVARDKLVDDDTITEGIAIASILPGPVAVNVAVYTGYAAYGALGAFLAFTGVLIPSFILMLLLSVWYFSGMQNSFLNSAIQGFIPVIAALLFSVALKMAGAAVKKYTDYLIMIFCLLALFFVPGYLTVLGCLFAGGFWGIIQSKQKDFKPKPFRYSFRLMLIFFSFFAGLFFIRQFFPGVNSFKVLWEFSKLSLTMFGGGYVMVPVMKSIFVDKNLWLTLEEFTAGVSFGQLTPGPILISSVFFGYKVNGLLGSFLAAIGIFLPSAILITAASDYLIKIKEQPVVQGVIRGMKPVIAGFIFQAAISLMLQTHEFLYLWLQILSFGTSLFLFYKYEVSPFILLSINGIVFWILT